MSHLIFTQTDGFSDYEVPEWFSNLGDVDFDEDLKQAGFQSIWSQNGHEFKDIRLFGDDDLKIYTPGSSTAYEYTGSDASFPRYAVEVNNGSCEYDWIHVRTRGDLFALRIQLAQLLNPCAIGVIEDLRTILSRTLRVAHRHHPHDGCCAECDPDEAIHRRMMERAREAREKIADGESRR